MSDYPDYVRRKLLEARDIGQYSSAQADGAAICFDLLADFPDCVEASETIYELFCDEWTIYDHRVALQRLIDEWDDQPHQQRRRLALSFGYMSRFDEWHNEDEIPFQEEGTELHQRESKETMRFLRDGKTQLLSAYCLGDEEATEYAYPRFRQAIDAAHDPLHVQLLVAKQYAEMGFFVEAVDLLLDVLSKQDTPRARRMLAEVRWWRDNAHRIPWIPPAGDGSRHDRLIKLIDPEAPTMQEYLDYHRAHMKEIEHVPTWAPVITPELKALFSEALVRDEHARNEKEAPVKTIVDWSFLDQEDGTSTEMAEWVFKDIRLFGRRVDGFKEDALKRHKLTRPIPPPKIPRKYDPRELRMSAEEMEAEEAEEEEQEFWDELNDEMDEVEKDEDDDDDAKIPF